ncbi:hypothetical protein [Vibrio aquimaris]|nr:hypothetical protein [Vibrio aquimaris]
MSKKLILSLAILFSAATSTAAGLCPDGEVSFCDGFGTCFCSPL